MVIQVYSKDKNGQKVMKGYGTLLIPTFPGHKTTYVHLFKPKSSTILQVWSHRVIFLSAIMASIHCLCVEQALIARLSGAAPEFKKPESVAGDITSAPRCSATCSTMFDFLIHCD